MLELFGGYAAIWFMFTFEALAVLSLAAALIGLKRLVLPAPGESRLYWPGLLAAGYLTLLFGSLFSTPPRNLERQRNASVQANVNTWRMAIEQYAADHDGAYPPAGTVAEALTRPRTNYFPGNHIPDAPWGGHQERALAPGLAGLPDAGQLARVRRVKQGQVLGRGRVPGQTLAAAHEFGAVLYDYDARTGTYVLYGVGRQGNDAIVAAVSDNGGDEPATAPVRPGN